MLIFSLFLSHISLNQDKKILIDFGLAFISLFSTVITLFIGSKIIFSEIYNQTIYLILSKPVKRFHFIFGKWLGLSAVLFTISIILSLFLLSILWFQGIAFEPLYLEAILFGWFEQLLLLSFIIFFATFTSSPIICLFCSISLYLAGHLTEDLMRFALQKNDVYFQYFADTIYYLTPNFSYFNLRNHVVYNIGLSLEQGLSVFLYGLCLVFLILLFSAIIFEKKEF